MNLEYHLRKACTKLGVSSRREFPAAQRQSEGAMPAAVTGPGLPRMPPPPALRNGDAGLTAGPASTPPRHDAAPSAAASFVSSGSATRAGPGSSTDAIAALLGDRFLVSTEIYYQVNADVLAFLRSSQATGTKERSS